MNKEQEIEYFLSGDKTQFGFLYKKYFHSLFRISFAITGSEQAAEDILHDVFLHLWENRDRTKIESTLEGYLKVAVRNRSLNLIRKKVFQSKELDKVDEDYGSNSVEESIYSDEAAIRIQSAIATLPLRCRQIFMMSRIEGMSYKEIAKNLSLSIRTIEAQMGIAIKKLLIEIKKNE